MKMGRQTAVLEGLRERIQRLERTETTDRIKRQGTLPFDAPALDLLWPQGGLPVAALHEVASDNVAGFAAATAFVASIAARLDRTVLWCCADGDLYAPGLARLGLHPSHLLVAAAKGDVTMLRVMEEGLRHASLSAVVGELANLDLTASRRLQLASEKSGTMALVLRKPLSRRDANPIAATTRWRVSPLPSAPHFIPQAGRACWKLELLHARHGQTGSWIIEAPNAQGYLHLSSAVADRGTQSPPAPTRRLAG